ncbi:MAG: cupin domain-containing protein [Methyloceanibacter sp.]|uniref:cupin domain-containing protein n=1 Tax=Methyloceanibacter sp. TaxID=1965321 RepID=UPI003D6D71F4
MTRIAAFVLCLTLVAAVGAASASAREAGVTEGVTVEQLLAEPLAGEPGKEVVTHLYTFPGNTVLPWHVHPGTHEIAYVLEGDFAIEIDGEAAKPLKPGESFYMRPDAIHRGISGKEPVKLFVVRIKPVGEPLAVEVEPKQAE